MYSPNLHELHIAHGERAQLIVVEGCRLSTVEDGGLGADVGKSGTYYTVPLLHSVIISRLVEKLQLLMSFCLHFVCNERRVYFFRLTKARLQRHPSLLAFEW